MITTGLRTFATGVTALYLVVLAFAALALLFGFAVFLWRTFFGEGAAYGNLPALYEGDAYDDRD